MNRKTLTSRERVLSALNRDGYDRIPVKHEATPEVNRMLMDHFGLANMEQLLRVVGDDFRYVAPRYIGPELRTFPDGSVEGYWGERYRYAEFAGGNLIPASSLLRALSGLRIWIVRIFHRPAGSITRR